MSTIGSLEVAIRANTENFSRGMKKARTELTIFQKGMGSITSAVRGFGAALAAGFTVSSLSKTITQLDDMADAAERLGVSLRSLSGLSHAGSMTGLSQDGLFRGLTMMEKNVANGAKAFGVLGLSIKDLKSLQADEMFMTIADAINSLPTASERTAAALAIFGKSGAELMELIGKGRDGIAGMIAEGKILGTVLDDNLTGEIAKADKAMRTLMATFEGWKRSLAIQAAEMLPGGTGISESDRKWVASLSASDFAKKEKAMAAANLANTFFGASGILADAGMGVVNAADMQNLAAALQERRSSITNEITNKHRKSTTGVWQNPGMGGSVPGMEFGIPAMMRALEVFNRFGGGMEENFSLADQHRAQNRIDEMLEAERDSRKRSSLRDAEMRGNAALEQGSAAAFSQEKRSQQQGNQIWKQQLEEAKKQTKALNNIDKNLKATTPTLPANLA